MSPSHHTPTALLPDRVSIAFSVSVQRVWWFLWHIDIFSSLEGRKFLIHNSDCWMKWLQLKYWWLWNIAAAANRVFLALSLLLVAFSGSAKCFEPRPHPVHTQTGGAGQRVRDTAVSRWVRCLGRTPTWPNTVQFEGAKGAFRADVQFLLGALNGRNRA